MEDLSEHRKTLSQPAAPSIAPLNWLHVRRSMNDIIACPPFPRRASRSLFTLYLVLASWLVWQALSLFSITSDKPSVSSTREEESMQKYFADFVGYSECAIRAKELYSSPARDENGFYKHGTFCSDRKHLLQALSGGGRVGFDAPYVARDCNYRWFTPAEMCNILTRFDSIVFIGDDSLLPVYGGLNILLRQDLALGAMDPSSLPPDVLSRCRCNNQYIKQDCRENFLKDSEKLPSTDDASLGAPYIRTRFHHGFLHTTSQILDPATTTRFQKLVPQAPRSSYRPIPIVTSLSPSTVSQSQAATFLVSLAKLADDTSRNTPMLWIGPTAAGHIEIRGRKGNQEIWDFDQRMADVAAQNDVDVLGMWNLTVQASSWDGMRFGMDVAIVQAMMVVNWLSRLESS